MCNRKRVSRNVGYLNRKCINFVLVYRLSEEGLSTAMSSFNTDDVLLISPKTSRHFVVTAKGRRRLGSYTRILIS